MKTSAIALIVACGVIAGALVYLNRQKTPTTPAPIAESASKPVEQAPPETTVVPKPEPPPTIPIKASESTPAAAPTSVADDTKPNNATNSISKAVTGLLTAKSAAEKHGIFQQLIKDGQMDQAIAELKERAAANPNDPEIPTTLGEALLNKVRAARESGTGDMNDIGIMAMQADQSFNAALKIDPKNFEANLVKSISQSYWPANPEMDNDVVQRLSSLIDQQDANSPQPEMVQTYLALIRQHEKMGKNDEAQATILLALQKFPNDPGLQKAAAAIPH